MPILAAAIVAVAGCTSNAPTDVQVTQHMMVWGEPGNVRRFVAQQSAILPAIEVASLTPDMHGAARARITLPATVTGSSLVKVTRAALATGLSYRVDRTRIVTTPSSWYASFSRS